MSAPRRQPTPRRQPAPRLALSVDEAAASIGIGRSLFYEQVLPELRVVRLGKRRLVPRSELERWLEENAARTLEP
jgi:excisionase family DNA binding protein